MGCCYSFGFGAMMAPVDLTTRPVDRDACLEEQPGTGGARGWSEACPPSSEVAAEWARDTTAFIGCCYSIGWGNLMAPVHLVTELADSRTCLPDGHPEQLDGGMRGWSETCPLSNETAATWVRAATASPRGPQNHEPLEEEDEGTDVVPGSRGEGRNASYEEMAEAAGWHWDRRAELDENVTLHFWVRQTHLEQLDEIFQNVSDPRNPDYGHFRSRDELDALTAPRARDVAVVEEALHSWQREELEQGARINAVVPISFAEYLLGGVFVYFCYTPAADEISEEDATCRLRNPTAQVPHRLREACDIIQPIDDPLEEFLPIMPGPVIQPIQPPLMPGPVIYHPSGCCFSLGLGSLMRPCCLSTEVVDSAADCPEATTDAESPGVRVGHNQTGGVVAYNAGACPLDVEEAADLVYGSGGCCFSINFGDGGEPCCLTTDFVATETACALDHDVHGGVTGYKSGRCPATAREAATLIPGAGGCCFSVAFGSDMRPCCLSAHFVESEEDCGINSDFADGATGYVEGACPADAEAAAAMIPGAGGCCFSIGFGPFMDPCCLSTRFVSSPQNCSLDHNLTGGATGYREGSCPSTAIDAALAIPGSGGCCYSIGYGTEMKPCCLVTEFALDSSECAIDLDREGGITGFVEGACPSTSREASMLAFGTTSPAEGLVHGTTIFTVIACVIGGLLVAAVVTAYATNGPSQGVRGRAAEEHRAVDAPHLGSEVEMGDRAPAPVAHSEVEMSAVANESQRPPRE